MKTVWATLVGGAVTLLAVGLIWLASKPPRGEAIRLLPPPTPQPLWVQVAGAVVHPGVYSLPVGARVQDAIQEAGGLLAEADGEALNLVAILKDGQIVRVPRKISSNSSTSIQATASSGLVNINTATLEDLEALPGIGEVLARRILDYRLANGPFGSVDQLREVEGLREGIFAKIKDLVTVEDTP